MLALMPSPSEGMSTDIIYHESVNEYSKKLLNCDYLQKKVNHKKRNDRIASFLIERKYFQRRFEKMPRVFVKAPEVSAGPMEELTFEALSENHIMIEAVYKYQDDAKKTPVGYRIVFSKWPKCIKLSISNADDNKVHSVLELNGSINVAQYTADMFRSMLQCFQTEVKTLNITGRLFDSVLENYDFGINNLRNLESLHVCDGVNVQQIFSAIGHPLKLFHNEGRRNSRICTNWQKLYQVEDKINMPVTTFNFEQFRKLRAKSIYIHVGQMSEGDVCLFLISWMNGRIRDDLQYCAWVLRNSWFEIPLLLELLGKERTSPTLDIKLEQTEDSSKKGSLFLSELGGRENSYFVLSFHTSSR